MAERGPAATRAPRRPTVGLVTANIHLGVGASLWAGVLEAAERNDVNVVCFPGDALRPDGAPRNAIYDLIGRDLGPLRLDGAICWTSTLGLPAGALTAEDERAERLIRHLSALPVVSLNRALAEHAEAPGPHNAAGAPGPSGQPGQPGLSGQPGQHGPGEPGLPARETGRYPQHPQHADHETLLLDSYAGMRKAVSHLVQAHGRRRLACLRGPLANPVSVNRFRAYADALAQHRIRHDRSLVSASVDFANGAGASAMRVLVDVRGLRPGRDFDAVVACSDVLAADALRFLAGRGVRVPEDVAVISFNDSLEARLSDPPLTSVALPFAELGALAVDTLLARLRGGRPPARRAVPGTLVTRRSCGCHSPLVIQGAPEHPPAEARPPKALPTDTPAAGAAAAGAAAAGAAAAGAPADTPAADALPAGAPPEETAGPGADGSPSPSPSLPEATAELTEALRADIASGTGVTFLSLLERRLDGWIQGVEDAAAWDRALLRLRADLRPDDARAERLLGQARLMVADKSRRLLEYERWTREQESIKLRELGTTLTTVVDTEAIRTALGRHLPGLGVPGCRLLLNTSATGGTAGQAGPLAWAGADGEHVPRPPLARVPREDRFTVVLEALHIGEEQLGFALFDAGPRQHAARHGALYRALGDQISAALKGVRLFEEVRRARDAAEQASQFKTRLLDNATDELRTPVESILNHTRGRDPAVAEDAERLLRLIDDLLDLTRSEIDALDLTRRLLDPRPLLTETFGALARPGWRLALPRRLPALRADAFRLRQIVRGLITATAGPGAAPGLELAAEAGPDRLHVDVTSPELTVPPDEDERLFQPFAAGEPGSRLSLAIARRLAVLHGGSVAFRRRPRPGFHLELPLPTPAEQHSGPPPRPAASGRTLLVAASAGPGPREVAALAGRHGLVARVLHPDDDVATLTSEPGPAAVAWDTERATAQEWATIRRLHDHPALRHTPFLLYGPVGGDDLGQALHALRPSGLAAPALIVDGSAHTRERLRRLLTGVLPGRTVRAAADGTAACALFAEDPPGLLIVDRALPDMDGFELVERLHEATGPGAAPGATGSTGGDGGGPPSVPVLMLSDTGFTFADARRAERHPSVVLLGRDVLTDAETARLLTAMIQRARTDPAAQRTYAPVRHALAYLEQHYRHRFSRWQVAQAAGVSEDHLGRLFHRELGVTLWEYLTRLRIKRAKERLQRSDDSVQTIARAVGFHDRAYFSRVFRKVTGVAPHAYRDAP
ncbi:substrate-binding domain-containing protein [Streptomyces sp. B6B3]|uniref:substrate-binding domain-containing protein n=1 Tax=Streptomyces sp. B6B3 TaxID=3153570 RepID=UPI00325C784B